MNSLTVNLHLLMVSFYAPTPKRFKILFEAKAFPSDYFAFHSQVQLHGFDADEALVQLRPREGEVCVRMEDVLRVIEEMGDEIAVVLFSGVQFYTGQLFDMQAIASAAKQKGCIVGFDLAHAVGNVELKLHDWQVDFASWCSYKYLNGGPGNIGGAFMHSKHFNNLQSMPRLAGWWGSKPESKFDMDNTFTPIKGAYSLRLSNPSVLSVTCLYASCLVFDSTSIKDLRARSLLLTGYLHDLLHFWIISSHPYVQIITPSDPKQRGCQLSILFKRDGLMMKAFGHLLANGVVCDERKPDVIRVAPAPLYNTFKEVFQFVQILKEAIQ